MSFMLLLLKISNKFYFNKLSLSWVALIALTGIFYTLVGWGSLFFLNIFLLTCCLLAYNYLSVFGLLLISFASTFYLMLKTWNLFYNNLFQYSSPKYWYVGAYSSITDVSPINLTLTLDTYNLSYVTLTLSIGCWAILYAYNYMRSEPRVFSFVWLLLAFLYSMVLLLTGNSFTTILLGWELIGSFSFLLINFWTTRVSTFKAALKAFFFNKLSDLALLIVLILFFFFLSNGFIKNLNLVVYAYNVKLCVLGLKFSYVNVFLFFLSICCFCKSAQFGFHIWLPDSMEAPVPASALIHSATLVSAGIYLFGRVPAHIIDPAMLNYIMFFSSFTAFYGGVAAAYQTDLKRILAYSTISHCGFLFFILTLDNYYSLLLYLHLHGWLKSLSFMCAGNVISASNNYQDYRRMGGVTYSIGLEQLILSLAVLNLGSLPFLLGFFSKHFLLTLFGNTLFFAMPSIFILSASVTGIFYSTKFLRGVFYSSDKRNLFLKLHGSLVFDSKPSFTNSSGTQILNLISLVSLTLTTSLTALLLLVGLTDLNPTYVFEDYCVNATGLVYANLYTLILFNAFSYKTSRVLLAAVSLIFVKFLYLCA